MSRNARGQISIAALTDGTNAFQLRFRAHGRRERVTLHERRACECGCSGGGISGRLRLNWETSSREWRRASGASAKSRARALEGYPPSTSTRPPGCRQRSTEPSRSADRRQHRGRLPVAIVQSSPALLREVRPRRARSDPLPSTQGDQASRGRRASRGDRRWRGDARPEWAPGATARTRFDPQAHLVPRSNPRRGDRGRPPRSQPRTRETDARQGAQAESDLPRDGRAVALTDAADEQDAPLTRVSRSQAVGAGSTAAQIAERLTAGMRSSEIAAELGLAKQR